MGNSASNFLELIMLISLVEMLNQTRIGIDSITYNRRGLDEVSAYYFLMSKSRIVYSFLFTIIILGNSVSHFLEVIMLISLVGIMKEPE